MTPQEPTTYDGRRVQTEYELVALDFDRILSRTQVCKTQKTSTCVCQESSELAETSSAETEKWRGRILASECTPQQTLNNA